MQPMVDQVADQASAILASVDPDGVEFALPSSTPGDFRSLERIDAGQCPTFTDALMRYAANHRIALRHTRLVMSIAGAVNGTTIRTTNGRWFISLSGLQAVTAGEPIIVNQVGAMAWATADQFRNAGRSAIPSAPRVGRHAVVYAGSGLGAACVDQRGGGIKIVESEAGHIPFAPQSEADWELARTAMQRHGEASYERVIFDLIESDKLRGMSDLNDRLTIMLANYCSAVAMTFAAWDGLYLNGHLFDRIAGSQYAGIFRDTFEGRGKMRTMLQQTSSQMLQLRHSSLNGLSILLNRMQAA